MKGHIPVGFVVCNKNVDSKDYDKICEELIQLVREEMGAVASFKNVSVVPGLPKTRSGKILRGTMKKIADGDDFQIVGTIEDRSVFDFLVPAIKNAGRYFGEQVLTNVSSESWRIRQSGRPFLGPTFSAGKCPCWIQCSAQIRIFAA